MVHTHAQYYYGHMANPMRVVTIGGGTGHFVLLSGLREHPYALTAIVSMADDGGSSGMLRDELGVLPPGDVRQCLVALSRESATLRQLFSYRFEHGGLSGHSFGNLFLSALEKVSGSFSEAVREAGRVLSVCGEVLPVSEEDMRLVVTLENGEELHGEQHLDTHAQVRAQGVAKVALRAPVAAHPLALARIKEADAICIGPGDLFGSVLPPLLVPDIARALRECRGTVVYTANLTNKVGHTEGFTAHDYVRVIHDYVGAPCIDVLLVNSELPTQDIRERYQALEGSGMVEEGEEPKEAGYATVRAALLSHEAHERGSLIRHDKTKLANALYAIMRDAAGRGSTHRHP